MSQRECSKHIVEHYYKDKADQLAIHSIVATHTGMVDYGDVVSCVTRRATLFRTFSGPHKNDWIRP